MYNFVAFLLGLAFVEGFLKPLIVYLTQRQIRKFMPLVLDRLDPVLPRWIAEYDQKQLKERVIDVIFDSAIELDEAITLDDAYSILDGVVSSYSFLVNADKTHS